jgi:hypothetical protein
VFAPAKPQSFARLQRKKKLTKAAKGVAGQIIEKLKLRIKHEIAM